MLKDTSIIYFISGHTDLSRELFDRHYKEKITSAALNPNSRFIMGDAPGADFMAQQLLISLFCDNSEKINRIRVYHRGDKPYKLADPRIKTVSGFKSHNDKDNAMTLNSNIDIAYVRSNEESKLLYGNNYNPSRISGTEKNLERRIILGK